ncbi:hypothetical protein [Bdellovibrio bacteriovorus]|uniref:Uncharacterized protein n=1 Tax=Bdellovibrio bacteriovorus str. Tiberius TaxID=1069642 RepID=K7ZBK8_BDEBC|nr:hypothetical protein [Bdellovibrio bacteriovorus]AFY02409.1 Hypothetical protein Bdt_2728 [Bdellovibrio bacteriovorus str. Tiberius]
MKKYVLSSLVILFAASAFAGGGTVGTDAVVGSAQRFYYGEEEIALDELTQELHANYNLLVVKSDMDRGVFPADVTKYSDIAFLKLGNGYRMVSKDKNNGPAVADLDPKYNSIVGKLFSDLQQEANFIAIDGASEYGRGGSSLFAANLSGVEQVTLVCQRVVYSDRSGGTSCKTKTSGIDFAKRGTVVMVSSARGGPGIVVPKKYLKTWDSAYWDRKF